MSSRTWSSQQELELRKLYMDEGIEDPLILSEKLDKKYRSVVSKLVQLGIYKKPIKITRVAKNDSIKLLFRELESILEIRVEGTNLNKKENLIKVVEALRVKVGKD